MAPWWVLRRDEVYVSGRSEREVDATSSDRGLADDPDKASSPASEQGFWLWRSIWRRVDLGDARGAPRFGRG